MSIPATPSSPAPVPKGTTTAPQLTPNIPTPNIPTPKTTTPTFTLPTNVKSHQTWHHPLKPHTLNVQIVVEHPSMPRGIILQNSLPLIPLQSTCPAILEYLTLDGTALLFPHSSAIDEDILLGTLNTITLQHSAGVVFDLDFSELPDDPVELIRVHVVLSLLGLGKLADGVLGRLWTVFGQRRLTPAHVFWMWSVFGPYGGDAWTPRWAGEYGQMMAWNLLRADAEGGLDEGVREFFVEGEGEPRVFAGLVEERFRRYGIGREALGSDRIVSREREGVSTESQKEGSFPTPVYTPTHKPPRRPVSPPFIPPLLRRGITFRSAGMQLPLDTVVPSSPEPPIFPAKSADPWHRTPQHGSIQAQQPENYSSPDGARIRCESANETQRSV
ncbi:hypothetical protein EJ07DRAFT_152000 [Lizonia empirigonia]|nr:hypothetical protein EJ07DRAFT_152000 [Lizonia empirigonia]